MVSRPRRRRRPSSRDDGGVFEGTVEGLNDYLNTKTEGVDEKADLTEKDVQKMLGGAVIYDPTGESWSVEIKEGDR